MEEVVEMVNRLSFISIDDLFIKKNWIKEQYSMLEYEEKMVYKWYFYYQLCILKNPLKDYMWRFINDEPVLHELEMAYVEFCERREEKRKSENRGIPNDNKPKIWDLFHMN